MRQLLASFLILTVPASLAAQAPVAATQPMAETVSGRKDYAQISLEELLNKDIVVAATKTRIDVAKAPVSVTVLTPDDIRRSGVTSLGELFRAVPGLDVLESFPGHISVSARGTSEVFVNNMLVLIDGRRLEFQVAGVPFFENAPVRLEDVKRIEVIKGPAGALYGTNALAGVISITTYAPDEMKGTLVSLTGGNRDTAGASFRHAGRAGAWSYKLLGGYTYTSTWATLDDAESGPSAAIRKGDLLAAVSRGLSDDSRVDFEAGLTKGDLASLTVVTTQTRYFTWPHFRLAYGRPDFHAQLSYSPQDSELRERTGPVQPLTDKARALNLSADKTLRPFSTSTVTVGGTARYQRSTFTSIATPHSQTVWGLFVQDEQQVVKDKLSLFGAVGLSDHPEIPLQVDANAALVVTPVRDHSFRVSFGRGHRDPSFNENFYDFRRRIGNKDGYQAPNLDLDPESIQAWEAGYHGRARIGSSDLRLFLEAWTAKVENLVGTVTSNVAAGTVAKYPTVTVVQQFQNLEDRDGKGFETGLDWERGRLRLAAHYAYQRFENAATGAEIERDIPRHKVSAGLHLATGKVSWDVWTHSVSETLQESYVLVNPQLSLDLRGFVVSLRAFNLLDESHVEVANDRGFKGEALGRSLTLNLTKTFGGH
jgi:iron complex outermembrane receptor protein